MIAKHHSNKNPRLFSALILLMQRINAMYFSGDGTVLTYQ